MTIGEPEAVYVFESLSIDLYRDINGDGDAEIFFDGCTPSWSFGLGRNDICCGGC